MCGGNVVPAAAGSCGTCDACGGTMTLPRVSDERRANLYNRANHLRRLCEFDKAVSAYEAILGEDNTESEAHWGVVLSRYGIEYVEDPGSGEKIPTCHRVEVESVLLDADYLMALEHAPRRNRGPEVASISRTESERNQLPWNPSSKTPLPKRAGSSINRSNARSFATGYRAVSLRRSLRKNLVLTKACSSLGGSSCPPPKLGGRRRRGGRRPAVEDLQSQLDAARREIRHLHEQRDILKKRWAFSPNRPGTLRTGSRDEIRPFHRDALRQPRGFA